MGARKTLVKLFSIYGLLPIKSYTYPTILRQIEFNYTIIITVFFLVRYPLSHELISLFGQAEGSPSQMT